MKTAKALPVLMYHHVSPAPGLVTVSPENFRAQMRWLVTHGWYTVGLDDLARFLKGEPLPAKSVVITFDDGYLDNYVYAHPIMAEFGLHGTIFIVTGWIGDGPARAHAAEAAARDCGPVPTTPAHKACMEAVRAGRHDDAMLRWSEVERMRDAGTFEFHSHTHTHTRWDRDEADSSIRQVKLAADLERSRAMLQARLGAASAHLCWPQGWYDDGYIATARCLGFTMLYTTLPGTNDAAADPLHLRRIVTKDAPGWLGSRLWIYRHPRIAAAYQSLRRNR